MLAEDDYTTVENSSKHGPMKIAKGRLRDVTCYKPLFAKKITASRDRV